MKKNKVILVNPGINFQKPVSYGMYPNTAIMILATILHNAGFRVKVIDGKYQNIDAAARSILNEMDDSLIFIGFSVMTIQLPWAYYVSKMIKSRHPRATIVWGGSHPTLFPEQTVEDPAVDIVMINDAASTVASLTSAISGDCDLSAIPGICYKVDSRILRTVCNQGRDNFNNIPLIDFSLINHEFYSRNNNVAIEEFYKGRYKKCRVYPLITGLGCTYRCTFCINVILKRQYCFREAGEIIDRIQYLQKNYGADFIQPMDENFFINRKRTLEFLDLVEKKKIRIKWRPQARVDHFREDYINLEMAKRLDRSGMVVAAMGAESASQKILDKLEKRLKVEDIIKAVEILSKTNIIPRISFMVGLPGEKEEDIKETFQLAIKLRKMANESCVTVSPFRPYPGSSLYDQIVSEYGYSPPSNLRDWARLSKEEFIESHGYESFENYKWVKNPRRLKAMQEVYYTISWYKPEDDSLYGKICNYIAFMRFRFNFFTFAYPERIIFKILSRFRNLPNILKFRKSVGMKSEVYVEN